jgi:hypothetical protein
MEYGLRHYEAVQRLFWFLFFLLCTAIAYPIAKSYVAGFSHLPPPPTAPHFDPLKNTAFWFQMNWLRRDSLLGFFIVYLGWLAVLFLAGRVLWLLVQVFGELLVKRILTSTVKSQPIRVKSTFSNSAANWERLFPAEALLRKVNRFPLSLIFHPYQRLRLMFGNPTSAISSQDLIERERRIVEADWQVFSGSWAPFRWLLWPLPLLALLQSVWLFYIQLQPALTGQRELLETFHSLIGNLVPVAQASALAVALCLAGALIRRLEELYLSNVDDLLYDHFLSRLPFQSSDTVILLEALKLHFLELQQLIRRLEQPAQPITTTTESND